MTKPLRGADIVARPLPRLGCRHVFTLSGNHIMSIFDAALERSSISCMCAVRRHGPHGRCLGTAHRRRRDRPGHRRARPRQRGWRDLQFDPRCSRPTTGKSSACAMAEKVLDRIARGEVVKASGYYVRTAPFFETGSEKYKRLTALSPSASATGCLRIRSPRCSRFSRDRAGLAGDVPPFEISDVSPDSRHLRTRNFRRVGFLP